MTGSPTHRPLHNKSQPSRPNLLQQFAILLKGHRGHAAAQPAVCDPSTHMSAQRLRDLLEGAAATDRALLAAQLTGKCMHGESIIAIDLSHLNFQGTCFRDAVFGLVDLSESNLAYANLGGARLDQANLTGANLERASLKDASLVQANLTRASFLGANLRGADLEKATFDHTLLRANMLGAHIQQEHKGEYLEARDIYLRLKKNFLDIGTYDGAAWAYVRERIMERKTFAPWRAGEYYKAEEQYDIATPLERAAFYIKYGAKWLWAWAQELAWGYGQLPLRVLGVGAVVVVLFAVIYGAVGGIEGPLPQTPLSFSDYLNFSLAAFTTSSLPHVEPVTTLAQLLASLEGMLGVSALALFTTGLAQKMGGR